MKLVVRIAKTELRILFCSPIAWFILIVFSFMTAMKFVDVMEGLISSFDLGYYKNIKSSVSAMIFNGNYGFWNSLTNNLYIYLPLLTMGLISREYSSESIKLLYSSPINSVQIIIGKYLASIIFGLALLIVPIISMIYGGINIPDFDWGAVLPGLLGLYLLICAYCAIGLFMSSLTSYQVVAAVGTLLVFAFLRFIGGVGQGYDFIREITYWLSINGRTSDMLSGMIRSDDILYFALVIMLFLSLGILKIYYIRTHISYLKKISTYTGLVIFTLLLGYFTSKPIMMGFYDATRTKTQTITSNSQEVLSEIDGKVTITNYVNLLDTKSFQYLPMFFKNNESLFRPYLRFKPDLSVKYVYYYDSSTYGINNNAKFANKSLEEMRDYLAMVYNLNVRQFKSPEEIKKIIDLSAEGNSFVRVINDTHGNVAYIRDFEDNSRVPSETEITSSFMKMISSPPKVAFIRGNGEREIFRPGDRDYSGFAVDKYSRAALVNQGFDVVSLDITKSDIPKDIKIIILADPKREFSQKAYISLKKYIDNGGNMLILTDEGRQNIMNGLLSSFGIKLDDGILVQQLGDFSPDLLLAKLSKQAENITYGFNKEFYVGKKRLSMPRAVSLSIIAPKQENFNGFKRIPLFATNSKGAWIEKGRTNFKDYSVSFDSLAGEEQKTYVVSYALQRKLKNKDQKIIVVGDADCISNSELKISRDGYSSGNFNFIIESFRWLTNDKYPINTRRPDCKDNNLLLTVDSISWLKLLFLIIIPLFMIISGLSVWMFRNKG